MERYMTITFQDRMTIKMIGGVRNSSPAIAGLPFGLPQADKRLAYARPNFALRRNLTYPQNVIQK